MNVWRVTCLVLLATTVLSGCVREEEALTDNMSPPIGGDTGGDTGGDNPPPATALALSAPPPAQAEATGPQTIVALGQPQATGGDGTYSYFNDAPGGGFGLGTTPVMWTVIDGTGAQATAAQVVNVADTTPPILQKPADMIVAATGTTTMVNLGTATATDIVDTSPVITNDMPENGFPMGSTPVTWTATDTSGNTATGMQLVTVMVPSGEPLAISAPQAVTQEATGQLSNVNIGNAAVTGGMPPIEVTNTAPAAGFPVGTASVTWTATDADGVSVTAAQTVAVVDTTPPAVTAPGPVTGTQGPELGNTIVALGDPTVTDVADPSPTVGNDAPSGGFPVGDTTVVWTATDASGNSSTATQLVSIAAYVVEQCSDLMTDWTDSVFPMIDSAETCGAACHTGANPVTTANQFGFPDSATDDENFEVFRTVSRIDYESESLITAKARAFAPHGGGAVLQEGSTNFRLLADFVDRARACETAPQPLALSAPDAIEIEASGAQTQVALGQPQASGGDGNYSYSNDAPPDGFGLGITTVTWTVTDGTGAQATAPQTVSVADTTAPDLQAPADIVAASTGTMTMVDIGVATATDAVDANPVISNDMPANGFPIGDTQVSWTATDASGNTAIAVQTVTVTQPSSGELLITAPQDVSVEATATLSTVDIGNATVAGGEPPIQINNDAPAGGFPVGNTTVTWTATDSASATVTATQTVAVIDTTSPVITAPDRVAAAQGPELGNTFVALGEAAVSDIADPSPSVTNDAPSDGFPVGETTVTWTATDASGYSATATQLVSISAYVVEQCADLMTDWTGSVFPMMDTPATCGGTCHVGATPLQTTNGFAFPDSATEEQQLEVFRTVARIDYESESLVTAKARGIAQHGGGAVLQQGSANYTLLTNFVARARACELAPPPPSGESGVIRGSGYEQLSKITIAVASRPPTADEANAVAVAGADQEAIENVLMGVLDGLMNEEAFYIRVEEIYNDILLTDRYANATNDPAKNFRNVEFFTTADYFAGRNDAAQRGANYGIARAPLALIRYIIENDRPFTEIVTADYTMVNPYSAVVYGVNPGGANYPFSSDNNPASHSYDDWRRVDSLTQTAGDSATVSTAGVISTHAFLDRYPSTSTNINRHRSSTVFDYFLGLDIESLAPRDGLDLSTVVGDVPTYEDPQCTVCHDVMDPVAGLFTKRDNAGRYRASRNYTHTFRTNGVPRMVPAGYGDTRNNPGVELPTNAELSPLDWLGDRIAADDRFAQKTARIVFNAFTGNQATSPEVTGFLDATKVAFIASGFNFKTLMKEVLLSDYFLAQNLGANENPNNYKSIGAGRLLTPEELDRRITAVTGGNYVWLGPNSNTGLRGGHYLLYGGIDSDEITTRATSPTSFFPGMQRRIANQLSCERVAADLYNGGTLFPVVDETVTPDNGGAAEIRDNLQFLHRHLLGEDLAIDSAEIDASYQLFLEVRALGDTAIPTQCRGGGSASDSNGTVLPWMAVINYLISDYRFLYN